MTSKYIISKAAVNDLNEIWSYIANNSYANANKVEDKIIEAFEILAKTPLIGHKRADLTDKNVRFWPVYSYQIIYNPDSTPVEIVRILSFYRDVPNII